MSNRADRRRAQRNAQKEEQLAKQAPRGSLKRTSSVTAFLMQGQHGRIPTT